MIDFVIGAQIDDPTDAELAERVHTRLLELSEVAGAEQHTGTGRTTIAHGETAGIAEVDGTRDERAGRIGARAHQAAPDAAS
ncbi:hypothetical protein GCM10009807_11720 [Microbacterium lacus]|uniref:Uncharacterized protein n=1 Tax=Microbacterium lacus TaxID=415217 RepID=A0ABN2GD06_9MICO